MVRHYHIPHKIRRFNTSMYMTMENCIKQWRLSKNQYNVQYILKHFPFYISFPFVRVSSVIHFSLKTANCRKLFFSSNKCRQIVLKLTILITYLKISFHFLTKNTQLFSAFIVFASFWRWYWKISRHYCLLWILVHWIIFRLCSWMWHLITRNSFEHFSSYNFFSYYYFSVRVRVKYRDWFRNFFLQK